MVDVCAGLPLEASEERELENNLSAIKFNIKSSAAWN